ncbi:MAG: GNAT family N-acetyltransferase [Gemmatimonadetes bacterium]|nr:GNAT family N-acetyltransferase [Gemmatimonadota bacterium]
MSIRRPDPRGQTRDQPGEADPLASAVWIRPSHAGDASAVRDLVFGVLAEYGLKPDHAATDSDLADIEIHYRARGGEFWVVEDGRGRIVGTCGLWMDPDSPARAELRKMYLLPETRGRGLGRRLLDTALNHARRAGVARMELETASTMTAAIGLYQSAGFVELDAVPDAPRCDRKFGIDLPYSRPRESP